MTMGSTPLQMSFHKSLLKLCRNECHITIMGSKNKHATFLIIVIKKPSSCNRTHSWELLFRPWWHLVECKHFFQNSPSHFFLHDFFFIYTFKLGDTAKKLEKWMHKKHAIHQKKLHPFFCTSNRAFWTVWTMSCIIFSWVLFVLQSLIWVWVLFSVSYLRMFESYVVAKANLQHSVQASSKSRMPTKHSRKSAIYIEDMLLRVQQSSTMLQQQGYRIAPTAAA